MDKDINKITETIIGCAYDVINTLGSGFLEKVYENALSIEIKTKGVNCEQQKPISIIYRGINIGEYYADLLVEDIVIVEIKASKEINDIHQAQLLNYLKATGRHTGLILNFGSSKLGIKRMVF